MNTNQQYSVMYLRKRKALLFVPVVMVPLLTLCFYALGGAGGISWKGLPLTEGLNMSLPDAKFDQKKAPLNKLGMYKQSERDSMKLQERRKRDPYFRVKDTMAPAAGMQVDARGNAFHLTHGSGGNIMLRSDGADQHAQALLGRLDSLRQTLAKQEQLNKGRPSKTVTADLMSGGGIGLPVRQPVKTLLPAVAEQGDPDLDKLNALMDKVLKVHVAGDGRGLEADAAGPVAKEPVAMLTVPAPEEVVSPVIAARDDFGGGFIDLDGEGARDSLPAGLIPAMVAETQTILPGEAVVLRTAAQSVLSGIDVPSGTRLSGKAVLSGDRMLISIHAIRLENRVIPVSLEVVDLYGIAGVAIKGTMNAELSRESANELASVVRPPSVLSGLGEQAVSAGLQAARNIFSRKIRVSPVTLPAGYQVLLRNTKHS